ncbi:amino acid ABC transporter permease [Falsirhodobacter sp. alg1]|uniref:amino acid ABC transporter permease n=1 Tax=Falsirhodobacter sp. alg1 TaxID=1472418 RepID=UPI0005EEBDCE|nr:ABC transporter permease subunit [Falsirhodobacter sp. alg1]
MERFLEVFFAPQVFARYAPDVLYAMMTTLWLGLVIILAGIGLGLVLACLRTAQCWWLTLPIVIFADVMRALPPLVLILIFYFGLPGLGLTLSGPLVLFIVLTAVLAAFAEEIFWAGLTALTRGQWEAGRATGLSFFQTLIHVALPQAVRMGIPSLVNRALAITKMTALGSVIGVKEILAVSSSAQAMSGSATPLTMAALAYLAIFLPAVVLARWLERRFSWRV